MDPKVLMVGGLVIFVILAALVIYDAIKSGKGLKETKIKVEAGFKAAKETVSPSKKAGEEETGRMDQIPPRRSMFRSG